jgi:hypothetical protein
MPASDTSNTVLVTYRPKDGDADKLEALVAHGGATLDRLGLLTSDPHLVFRAGDGDKEILIEILTWKDISITGNPPEEVRAIWGEMQKLVETRAGRSGIEIQHVKPVPIA